MDKTQNILAPLYISYKTQQGNMLQNILPPLTNDKRLVLPLKGSYYIFNIYIFRSPNSRKQDLLSNLKYVALYLQIYSPISILINISVYQYLFRWIGGCILARSFPGRANYRHRPAPTSTTNTHQFSLILLILRNNSYWFWTSNTVLPRLAQPTLINFH